MAESQNIEWKESWRDEYLKWICGFANAQGGRIYIGTRDDGTVIGVEESKKLLEDIPNKIQNTLGIIADVNLLSANGLDYIEIVVNPSSYPVNYKGEYHYRSGSTKQQLRGAALTQFIGEKTGLLWDAVPVDNISVADLDQHSLDIFRREAVKKKRMTKEDLDIPNEELLDHLDLLTNGKLKRAAVMLFYNKPGRIITGCYVKIGKFGEGSDLQYQDTIEGSLFDIADRVIDLIYTKYLKAAITYEHDVRVETYPFPREGVREAVYNALGHNNYADSVPIQIRIEDDAMYISNNCILPKDWTTETLMKPHKSMPFNPSIANAFYRAGYIEAWGRGIQKICEACQELGTPNPEYTVLGNDLTVKFTALESAKISEFKTPNRQNGGLDGGLSGGLDEETQIVYRKILEIIANDSKVTQKEISQNSGIPLRTIQRAMKELTMRGQIRRQGSKRYGYWEITD
ncbi:MAG: putative DNA binding domain-containing protein [Lachnospiraceae bacterium]|nr:putative DNA binding domain-containing protein [Lachnospiraceae bacterium]